MAGHSKWANTKYRKASRDIKRGKTFTKIIRELATAVRRGGGNIRSNCRLRAAVDKALENNMPRDTLNRIIARAGDCGNDGTTVLETIVYEGYGPGGAAVIVECLSDNRNRTASEVRHAFAKSGGNLGTNGSVSYLFTKKVVISLASGVNENTIVEAAIEGGADDVITYDNGATNIFILPTRFEKMRQSLESVGLTPVSSKVVPLPSVCVTLNTDAALKLLILIDTLKNSKDVQGVYHNGKIPDKAITIAL